MKEKSLMNEELGEALLRVGTKYKNVVVIDCGYANYVKTAKFKKWLEDRYFNVGLAEQNAIGMAVGMALKGKIPIVCSLAALLPMKAFSQIRELVCLPYLNIKIIGCYAGLSAAKEGATLQALEDMALMRSLANMKVFTPMNKSEVKKILLTITADFGPTYVRLDAFNEEVEIESEFTIGSGQILREEGNKIVIVAAGGLVSKAWKAVDLLKAKKIGATLINMPSIKPIDKDLLIKAAKAANQIFTVENHNVIGGLGSAVTEVLSEYCPRKVFRLGIQDHFGESGEKEDLLQKFWLDEKGIAEEIGRMIGM